jgi:adenylate cyclase
MVRGLEEWMLDGCFHFRGPRSTDARIVIVDLDPDSLDELRRPQVFLSPQIAQAVDFIHEQGAAAVGLDFMIPEVLRDMPELQEGKVGDASALGAAINRAGNVVLPRWKLGGGWRDTLPQWRYKTLERPEPNDMGFVNLSSDPDHFIRRQELFGADDGEMHMHFALALYARSRSSHVDWNEGRLTVGDRTIRLDPDQTMRINYVGPPGSFPTVSFRDVLAAAKQQRQLPVNFRNAIVIIGSVGEGTQDAHAVPFSNNYWRSRYAATPGLMSGPEVHANIVSTIADGAFIAAVPWITSLPALVLFGSALGLAFAQLNRIRSLGVFLFAGLVLWAGHHFGWKALCIEAFSRGNWRIEIVGMLLLGVLVWLGNFVVRWLTVRGLLHIVTGPFGKMLETAARPLDPGGEERVVTVLFADIRGFSTFAQKNPAPRVIALLNRYFGLVVPILEKQAGTVNQFMGDGIMVLFGAPEQKDDHALAAVRAALEMVRLVHQEQQTWAGFGVPEFRIGVGIHTGPAIIGVLGSSQRLTCTAIGATVNAAARIEAENKASDSEILLSESTLSYLPRADRDRLHVLGPFPVDLRGVGPMNLCSICA